MYQFEPGSFSDVANTETARELWHFLNLEESLIRFDTATYLSKPALQALQPELLKEFGDKIRPDRVKQMIGRMVRQIMEHHGYRLDQVGVRIPNGELFTSAARYCLEPKAQIA